LGIFWQLKRKIVDGLAVIEWGERLMDVLALLLCHGADHVGFCPNFGTFHIGEDLIHNQNHSISQVEIRLVRAVLIKFSPSSGLVMLTGTRKSALSASVGCLAVHRSPHWINIKQGILGFEVVFLGSMPPFFTI
jgi:hypothetical protein